jgi:hypothetical protein
VWLLPMPGCLVIPGRRLGTRAALTAQEVVMMDLVSVALTVGFFALSVALVALCDRL